MLFPGSEVVFLRSASNKKTGKAKGGKKRDHTGSSKKKGRGQRGMEKGGEHEKQGQRKSTCYGKKLCHCFPGYDLPEWDEMFTLRTLRYIVCQAKKAGPPHPGSSIAFVECQQETSLLKVLGLKRSLMKIQNQIASTLSLSRNISEKQQKVISLRRGKFTAHSSLMEISLQSF